MNFRCKIIELAENTIGSDIEILVALISPGEIQGDSMRFSITDNYVLVFDKSSTYAQKLMNNPQVDIDIDLKDFILRKIEFEDINQQYGYFHKELIKNINLKKKEYEIESDLIADSISECMFSCHPEMFLYYLYKVVITREFENAHREDSSRNLIFGRFKNVLAVIVMETFKVKHDNFDRLQLDEISDIKEIYADALDYAIGFIDAIAYFVMHNKDALVMSSGIFKDQKYTYYKYIQHTFLKAISIVERRIILNQKSSSYFGHEISLSTIRAELKLFPTPLSFIHIDIITDLARSKNLEKTLIDYLERNGMTIIDDLELREKLGTKWIVKHKDIITYFFIDRKNTLSHINFGMQKRTTPFQAMLNQGQLNLSIKNN